ncbi:inactive protein kinase SELMODRAFT_444075-like isoform X2 [Malania oleifera]|uniref:inactive protein kinase SELMODRAFT_444075-like isoform X2 n=1 Tax=Malania oleifera TaxID=397392 RepID=UPI0025AE52F8|nr:inactive protein kinase SELMODRAFT_444075-like isoform X2 [Malania oleifera]
MFPENFERNFRQHASTAEADQNVVVAVRAEKVISKTAFGWALTHVVHAGDCITLLAVYSGGTKGRRLWKFGRWSGDCESSRGEVSPDRIREISESCSQMVLKFYNQIEVSVRIKVVSATPAGAVAAQANSNAANWVVLDKKLKHEQKHCMDELHCNIVVMKGTQPKVLRLNLTCPNELQTPFFSASSSPDLDVGEMQGHRIKHHSTPVSSPEVSVLSSPDTVRSLFLVYEENPLFEELNKGRYTPIHKIGSWDDSLSVHELGGETLINLSMTPASSIKSNHRSKFWISQNHSIDGKSPITRDYSNTPKIRPSTTLLDKFVQFDQDMMNGVGQNQTHNRDGMYKSSIRDAIPLGRASSTPPPLCSQCQHKAPVFGKPPKRFGYEDLEEATDGFSDRNFLAEGGFGLVHRGVLRDGQVVAVKQLKFAGSQGDADFCREVRVLSCAQHRNVVLLIGFCIEGKTRVLVYEYICNGSLDFHLHGNKSSPLDWHSRLKIAIGTARGLSDFGLARLYCEWENSTEDRVIGTSGYLAPEYLEGGKITEKVDAYAFGVVLLELIRGRKPSDQQWYKGQHILTECFDPLGEFEANHILAEKDGFLDPCLATDQFNDLPNELRAMCRAASLCLRRDPEARPPMSKVLRILEGGDAGRHMGLDSNTIGSRSGHMRGLSSLAQPETWRSHSRKLSH